MKGWVWATEEPLPQTSCRRYQWERPRDIDPCRHPTACQGLSGRPPASPATVVKGSSRGAGYEKVHVRDRRTPPRWPTSIKLLADEQKETDRWIPGPVPSVLVLLSKGITCRRILVRRRPSYRSETGRKACRALDLKPNPPPKKKGGGPVLKQNPPAPPPPPRQTTGGKRFIKTISCGGLT